MIEIKSFENSHIKFTKKLLKSSKFRFENKQFLIGGLRICTEAVLNNVKIKKCFYTKNIFDKSGLAVQKILDCSEEKFVVNEKLIKQISDSRTPQGIVCCCEFLPNIGLLENLQIVLNYKKLLIAETIQNPSNLGAIIRTCDAFGIDALMITVDSCDVYNSKVLSASAGSLFRTKIFLINNISNFLIFLNNNNFKTCAMVSGSEAVNILNVNFQGKVAIVMGNEGNGIKQETLDACTEKITIPMKNSTESLNVSVAAGIVIWKATKQ